MYETRSARPLKFIIKFVFYLGVLVTVFIIAGDQFFHRMIHQPMGPAKPESIVKWLSELHHAQQNYYTQSTTHTYTGNFACLGSGRGAGDIAYVDGSLSSGFKAGYKFTLVAEDSTANTNWWSWSVAAWPIHYKNTGVLSFYIDNSGVVRTGDMGGGMGTRGLSVYREKNWLQKLFGE